MPDQSTIPVRPSTPTLDTFYLNYGASNPRYDETANGVIDHALDAFLTDKTYEAAKTAVNTTEVVAAERYLDDVEAYAKLHGGFWPANGAPATGDHTDVSAIEQGASSGPASSEPATPTTPAVTSEAQLAAAPPAPSPEATTHVIVPNDHVSFLNRLADDVEHGVEGAERAFVSAFRRVFVA